VPEVSVTNPLSAPYRTGAYLIYDIDPNKGPTAENFRMASGLQPHAYPASGSHQLDFARLRDRLAEVVTQYKTRDLFLVDLREETHGYLGGRAVSWYADNDFANVGMTPGLIQRDEEARLGALVGETTVPVFKIEADGSDNRQQQRELPVSYDDVPVASPQTERQAFEGMQIGPCTVHYVRIPVTDHCGPSQDALAEFCATVPVSTDPSQTWVHFHCHGGDGRTTSFLALYDILCWKASGDPLPPGGLEAFACRQCQIFSYCLNPSGCTCPGAPSCDPHLVPWKVPLADARWQIVSDFLARPA
jgi:hypothetical protein